MNIYVVLVTADYGQWYYVYGQGYTDSNDAWDKARELEAEFEGNTCSVVFVDVKSPGTRGT